MSSDMRIHAHGAGPSGGQLAQAMGRSKASLSTKIYLACDALGYFPKPSMKNARTVLLLLWFRV